MTPITTTEELSAFCNRLAQESYVTIDTEFIREKTYWPRLCLVQLGGQDEAHCIDVLAKGIDLTPLFELLANEAVLKVFHAARQDVEIFVKLTGATPTPMFDTQVAAMVCGFGEQVGYETLVNALANENLDKGSRFTDWSKRPLTERQLSYALGDVTHLRVVYEKLVDNLNKAGRSHWLSEEMLRLSSEDTYRVDPKTAYKRLKARTKKPKVLALLKELAAWRERTAQSKDLPRNHIIRDDALMEIAHHCPVTPESLERVRGMNKSLANGRFGQEMIEIVQTVLKMDPSEYPKLPKKRDLPKGLGPVVDLLRVLLKMKCEEFDVAQKLVASGNDLEELAAYGDQADVDCLKGWRGELFGSDAVKLRDGQMALCIDGKKIIMIEKDA